MVVVENFLATPLGCCPLQELTEAKISMRWAVHWWDDAVGEVGLVAWKMRMLTATDYLCMFTNLTEGPCCAYFVKFLILVEL